MMPIRIGADARCTDAACGQVSRIIVSPVSRAVTHLAVDPKRGPGLGRLVPADLVATTAGQIQFRCTLAEFQALTPAQETVSVPDLDPTGHANAPKKVNWGLVGGGMLARPSEPDAPQQVTVDSVPAGGVAIHRGLTVSSIDGEVGHVHGLIVEPGGYQVTHVLLHKGHLGGRKDVAVPIDAVTKIGTLIIHLSITKREVKDLPPAEV